MATIPKGTVWSQAIRLTLSGAICDVCEKRIKRSEKVIVSLNLQTQLHVHATCARNASLKAGK